MSKFLEDLQAEGRWHQWMRKYKDLIFQPFAKFCVVLKISPSAVTIAGFILGILSIWLLFINYWYFVLAMFLSLFLDGVDGALARHTNTVSKFGKTFDYYVDTILMILMFSALTFWLGEPLWIIGLDIYGLVFLSNMIAGSPLRPVPGRTAMLIPCMLGLPKVGLFLLSLYGITMAIALTRHLLTKQTKM
ncbi:MAG: CDP-alcohol phosphatidyltransferase family protein [bacterium]|nr:CDP-alcohol phosphatidyltransferase family protein [bacterium]